MKLTSFDKCTGCSACLVVCSRQAIRMKPLADDLDCLHPVIDETKCIECGACVRVCPVAEDHLPNFSPYCYVARTRDRELLQASSSGGMFSELARAVFARGGCVFGCAMQSLLACHVKAENETELAELRGSKYVQSDMGDCFLRCREELRRNRLVLFSGTPCQIAGLRAFLGEVPDNLLCVGLICHGVASPFVFKQYIREAEAHLGGAISRVSFRDKISRSGEQSFSVTYDQDGAVRTFAEDWSNVYMRSFLEAYSYRECCFDCHFRSGRCGADIVLGDFWGIESINPSYSTKEGASAVLVYTAKGAKAFEVLNVDSARMSYADISRRNANLDGNAAPPRARAKFIKVVRQGGGLGRFFEWLDYVPLHRRFVRRAKDLLRPLYRKIKYRGRG